MSDATVEDVKAQALSTALVALKRAATVIRKGSSASSHHEVEHVNSQIAHELLNTASSAVQIYHALD